MKIYLTFIFCFVLSIALGQGQLNIYQALNKIKSLPPEYTKSYNAETYGTTKEIDPTYKNIVKLDTAAIEKLLPLLSDTNRTSISNTCSGGFITYNQLAFCIINDIEPVPYALVTKSQWDVFWVCGILPYGFLDYLKNNPLDFQKKYWTYYLSEERQQILKSLRQRK